MRVTTLGKSTITRDIDSWARLQRSLHEVRLGPTSSYIQVRIISLQNVFHRFTGTKMSRRHHLELQITDEAPYPFPFPQRSLCSPRRRFRARVLLNSMVNNVNVNLEHVVAYLFALWIPYGLIDTQYQTGCLSSTANCVKLDKTGVPTQMHPCCPGHQLLHRRQHRPICHRSHVSSAIC